jgi:hypothetical protein
LSTARNPKYRHRIGCIPPFLQCNTIAVPCYDLRQHLHNQVVKSDRIVSFWFDTSADPAIWSFFALQRETESLSTL